MTYKNSKGCGNLPGAGGPDDDHDWRIFTERRLTWLYGPNHKAERAAQTAADLAAWNALGRKDAA